METAQLAMQSRKVGVRGLEGPLSPSIMEPFLIMPSRHGRGFRTAGQGEEFAQRPADPKVLFEDVGIHKARVPPPKSKIRPAMAVDAVRLIHNETA